MLCDGFGRVDPVLLEDRERLVERRRVGRDGAARNDAQVVPDDVAQDYRGDRRGRGAASQSTSFQRREVLADRVDLADIGPAREQGRLSSSGGPRARRPRPVRA